MTLYTNSINQYTVTIASGSTSGTATIPAVGATAFLIYQGSTETGTSGSPNVDFVRIALTNSTTITATRNTSSTNVITVSVLVIDPTSSLVDTVQAGTISLTAATSNTATITSVDLTRSVVIFLGNTSTSSSGVPNTSVASVELTNATTVTARLNSAASITASYVVVQFAVGVINSLQSFSAAFTSASASDTQTITSVNMNNTFIIYNGVTSANTSIMFTPFYALQLTAATTVTLSRGSNNANSRTPYYTVVEFVSGVLNSSVQRGTISLASATSATATITSVNTANTALNFAGYDTNSASAANTWFPAITLTDAVTVTASRNTASTTTQVLGYEVLEFANVVFTLLNWLPDYDADVIAPPRAAQLSTFAEPAFTTPAQNDFYGTYEQTVKPPAKAAQFSFVAQKTVPSPISQINWFPEFDDQVKPKPKAAQFSLTVDKVYATVTQNNWYPDYDQQVKPGALAARHSYFAQLLATPLTIINWLPDYDADVNPSPTAVKYSYFTEPTIPSPISQTNWYPGYEAQVKAAPARASYSQFAELLALPASILNWMPEYAAEVRPILVNPGTYSAPPIPTITAAFTPIFWYPSYDQQVKQAASRAGFSYFAQTLPTATSIINWLPQYPTEVKPGALTAKYSQFAQQLAAPLTITRWYPAYPAETTPPAKAALYSYFAETLTAPANIISWMPEYAADVKAGPKNNLGVVTPPIPQIAVVFTPNGWYPTYAAHVNPPKSSQPSVTAQPPINAIGRINWLPTYAAEVNAFSLSAKYSQFSETLTAPITITSWYPAYNAAVRTAPQAAQFSGVTPVFRVLLLPSGLYVLIIPLEDRDLIIPLEDRSMILVAEDRTAILSSEDRSLTLAEEDRTLTLPAS